MSESYHYDMPWRPNYEATALAGWIAGIAATAGVGALTQLPADPFWWAASIQGLFAIRRLPAAFMRWQKFRRLALQPTKFMTVAQLYHAGLKAAKKKGAEPSVMLGEGYEWGHTEGQLVYELLKRDFRKLMPKVPFGFMGAPWIHGLSPQKSAPVSQPLSQSTLHTLVVGSPGTGKSVYLNWIISQAIARQEAVIIIDPKGDPAIPDNARATCELMGHPERFNFLHPARSEKSVRISPTQTFTRSTEVASRIAALIPSTGAGDPFKSFSQMAVNNVVQAQLICAEEPTLVSIRRYLEGGPSPLVLKAVSAYGRKVLPDFELRMRSYLTRANSTDAKAAACIRFYRDELQELHPNPDLEGILSMFEHDRAHFGKMIASLLPVLNMLTSGDMAELLSPGRDEGVDNVVDASGAYVRRTNLAKIIEKGQVLYLGLDSLSDPMVGSAIGSIFLAECAAVMGQRYNFGNNLRRVTIVVDECAEVVNEQLIQLLNKSRGAQGSLYIATQTLADLEARMGSEAKANQVLGNVNHIIALRVNDPKTQEFVSEKIPATRFKYVMRTQGSNADGDTPSMVAGSLGERLMEEEGELFPARLLGMLPNLEYVGILSGGRVVKGRLPILTCQSSGKLKGKTLPPHRSRSGQSIEIHSADSKGRSDHVKAA